MLHIITMPRNISYYPTSDIKPDGTPVMALDLHKTYVQMIPERLRGVDRVIVCPDRLQYIAPDYEGEVYIHKEDYRHVAGKKASVVEYPMSPSMIKQMKEAYSYKKSISPQIFDISYFASNICSAYPDEEINLPEKLYFSWNPQEHIGNLNAGHTWLQKRPEIENVPNVVMPNKEKLIRRYQHESQHDRKQLKRNARADHRYIHGRNIAFSR